MFESFHSARRRRTAQRAVPWIVTGVIVHAALVIAAWLSSLWEIEKLELPRMQIRLAGAIGAPPPPPPAGATAPEVEPVVPRKKRVTDRVQPVPPAQVVPPEAVAVPEAEPASGAPSELENAAGEGGEGCLQMFDIGCTQRPAEVIVEVSQASGPTPLGRYDKLVIDAPDGSQGRGGEIVVVLEIDTQGRVARVELATGMDAALDTQAMQLALKFRFRPARDDDGVAIPSRVSWTFHVYPTAKTS